MDHTAVYLRDQFPGGGDRCAGHGGGRLYDLPVYASAAGDLYAAAASVCRACSLSVFPRSGEGQSGGAAEVYGLTERVHLLKERCFLYIPDR